MKRIKLDYSDLYRSYGDNKLLITLYLTSGSNKTILKKIFKIFLIENSVLNKNISFVLSVSFVKNFNDNKQLITSYLLILIFFSIIRYI